MKVIEGVSAGVHQAHTTTTTTTTTSTHAKHGKVLHDGRLKLLLLLAVQSNAMSYHTLSAAGRNWAEMQCIPWVGIIEPHQELALVEARIVLVQQHSLDVSNVQVSDTSSKVEGQRASAAALRVCACRHTLKALVGTE